MQSPPRILYAAGPGDIIGTYRHWTEGRDDPAQVAITYSGQFYELCRELGASAYVISTNTRREKVSDGQFILEHRPMRLSRAPGPLFHLAWMWYGLRLAVSARRFKADYAIVADGTTHWFMLGLMRLMGVRVIPTLHCVLWPVQHRTRGALNRIVLVLNARFFRRGASAILSLSNEITQQLSSMLDGGSTPIVAFLPSYRRESFGDGFPAPAAMSPFRIFFAGRIERNKGVFDLLEIARDYKAQGRTDIEFDLCGDGSQLAALRAAVIAAGLEASFRCHGHSTKALMREMYEKCHVVIVPTTSEFVEGFNKVVAEGILAGRPVITSSVCPALEYVKEGVFEVPPDNRSAYSEAILRLKEDAGLYAAKGEGCRVARAQFYDLSRSWRGAVQSALSTGLR